MIERRVKQSKSRIVKIFFKRYGNPFIAFALLISTLYVQITLVKLSYQNRDVLMREIIACSLVGLLYQGLLIYISILLEYKVFNQLLKMEKINETYEVISWVFGFSVARAIKKKQQRYKYKYMVMLLGIALSIAITALQFYTLKQFIEGLD